jgi:hypothetical protein
MNDPDLEEIAEQKAAQAAALSCAIAVRAVDKGLKETVHKLTKKVKTKYEWNKERVRDFRFGRTHHEDHQVDQGISIDEQLDTIGTASYQIMNNDPTPYLRDYKYNQFNAVLQQCGISMCFNNMRTLDLGGQLIGDVRLKTLCAALVRAPIEVFILATNKITDVGMADLAAACRTLFQLTELNLSNNQFTNAGFRHLCTEESFPHSLRLLDISCNALTAQSAFHVGSVLQNSFQTSMPNKLESLTVGGRSGKKVSSIMIAECAWI